MKYNLEKAKKIITKRCGEICVEEAYIMGSGLGGALVDAENLECFDYGELGLPTSKVKGHNGKLVIGDYKGKKVAFASRVHYYENASIEDVRKPFELLNALGVKRIILATATGGVNKNFKAGDIMLIKDHINFSGINPLLALNEIVFVDVFSTYDKEMMAKALQVAKQNKIDIKTGVHLQFSGPSYETPAEVIMARNLGVDTVSMSTALDIIICAYYKIKVLAFAVVANKAISEEDEEIITHDEVLRVCTEASKRLKIIIENLY